MWNLFSLLAFENLQSDWAVKWETAIAPALDFLWKGLLAIFVVIGLIILAVKLTSYGIAKGAEIKKRREETQASQTDESDRAQ